MSQTPATGGLDYHQAAFLISAATVEQCPPDTAREVAFVGRSNAGKSSAINMLTGQSKLARTSKTPGRTQLLNFFSVAPERYLVDLPGFGYAKVSAELKRKWQRQLQLYLEERNSLQGLIMLMDIRHPFMEFDQMMVEWCEAYQMPMHILLTKADKLKYGAASGALLQTRKRLRHPEFQTVQLFSALNGQGVDELRARLDAWLVGEESAEAAE